MKYPVNTKLFTKDGRIHGNGLVISHVRDKDHGHMNIIKNDYGDVIKLTDNSIKYHFFAKFCFIADITHKNYVFK